MNPALLQILQIVLPIVVAEAPVLARKIGALMTKENPTPADWEALRAGIKHYEAYGINPDREQDAAPATATATPEL